MATQTAPSWQTLTVGQFLDLYRLSITPDLEDMTRLERAVAILYDKTEREVEEMTMGEFTSLSQKAAGFITDKIPGKPVKTIQIGRQRYRIIYDPTKLKHRQYVELVHFGEKPVENMHLIMASIVQPVTWYGRRLPNNADDHPALASAMLQARVVDVYHAAVFFCKLYVNLIKAIRASLVLEMTQKGMTKEQA